MYLCVRVRVRVCEEDVHEKRKSNEREKKKNEETGDKRKHKLIHTDEQTDRRTDR